jgi:hypothetical protein
LEDVMLALTTSPLQAALTSLRETRKSWLFSKDTDGYVVVETANSTGAAHGPKVAFISRSYSDDLNAAANLAGGTLTRYSIPSQPAAIRARIDAHDKAGSRAEAYLGTVPQLRADIDGWIAVLTQKIAAGDAPPTTPLLRRPLVWGAVAALVIGGALLLKRR